MLMQKNTQVANGSISLPQKIQRWAQKSCVLLEEGAEYDTMYDDRTAFMLN